jgi:hypothetical protein
MFFGRFKKGFPGKDSVTEKECLQLFTAEELKEIARGFDLSRRYYLNLYMDCLEKEYLSIDPNSDVKVNQEEKRFVSRHYRHYNNLVQWIEKELEKR